MFTMYLIFNTAIALKVLLMIWEKTNVRVVHLIACAILVFLGLILCVINVMSNLVKVTVGVEIFDYPPLNWGVKLYNWVETSKFGRIIIIKKPG